MTVRSRLTTSGSQLGSHLSIAFGDRAPVRAALVSTGAQLAACTSLWMRFSRCGYMTIDVSTGQRDLAPADSRGWPAEARETVCHLAHDLCQPIAAIRALAYATPAEAEAPVLQRLRQISEEAAWIAEIVDDLLGGPRTSPLRRFDRTEIHELIRDVVASQRLTYTGRIVLHQASGSACYVAGSPAKLRRALANVVANATRAAGADGSVELTGSTLEDMAVIEIADSGPGFGRIAPVHGIGLRIARRVLAECEGHISFERRPPGQTVVRLRLPIISGTSGTARQ